MIPQTDLIRARDVEHARALFDEYPTFDHFPVPESGAISGYVSRSVQAVQPVSTRDLIADSTDIAVLPTLFVSREFFFVLSINAIVGFVHFSDLNNSTSKVPFYVMFQSYEEALGRQLSPHVTLETLDTIFGQPRAKAILKKRAFFMERDVLPNLVAALSFREILIAARSCGVIALSDGDADWIVKFRNRTAHVGTPFITSHDDVKRLCEIRSVCNMLLEASYTDETGT